MKLKHFTDVSDDTVCLVRVDSLATDSELFFLMSKESFYSIKHTDDTIEIDDFGLALFNVTTCQANLLCPVETSADGKVLFKQPAFNKRTASWQIFAANAGMKVIKLNCDNLGVILPSQPNAMLYPACNDLIVMSLKYCGVEADETEEGPNEDVAMSDDLCLISTSDKARFLKELSRRQKSGYELCNMTTSCIQVDGKLQVIFSSLLKAKEDKKNG